MLEPRVAGASTPLSIAPARTTVGFAAIATFALFLLGASRAFSITGVRGIARALAVLGSLVSLIGLYQYTSNSRTIYGWYQPLFGDGRSAPFVNANHQAGWLVMALSLTLGAFAGEVARGMRDVAPRWRDRIIWLSSKDANIAILLLFSSAVMAAGILASRSRSGAAAMVLTFFVVAIWNTRRQPTRLRRLVTASGLIALMLALLAFNGQPVIEEILATEGPGTRQMIWSDTWRIAGDYWLTGTGFNTYGAAMLHYQTVKDGYRYIEAHSDYLQLAAEGGLLVGIPFIVLAGVLILEIVRRFRSRADDTRTYWLRVGAVVGIFAMALQSVVEFTLQMPGGAVMFATVLAIAIHHPAPPPVRRGSRDA